MLDVAIGDHASAEPRLLEAWRFYLHIGDAKGIAWVGWDWGKLLAVLDRSTEAGEVWHHAIAACRRLGDDSQAQHLERMIRDCLDPTEAGM